MTLAIALAVIAAAICHALWNTILKAQPNQFVGYMVLLAVMSCLSAVGVFYYGPLPREGWGYLAVSVILHFAYNYLLVWCYRLADMSLVYPILRGAAPPIAAFAGFIWLAEEPSLLTVAGICLISAGIFYMIRFRGDGKAVMMALLTAAVIASYSVVDAKGVRVVNNAVQYLCWLSVFDGPFFILLMLTGRRRLFSEALQWRYLLLAAVGGVLALFAYGLVIYAYTMAHVGAVAALRETSVIFGVLAGMFFLGEPKSRNRIIGSLTIAAGAALIFVN